MNKLAIISACLGAMCLCGIGIVMANQDVPSIPVEHIPMQERVSLGGAFLHSNQEKTDGYSIKVDHVEVMSPKEYVEKYSLEQFDEYDAFTADSLVVLDISINNDSSEGYLVVADWKLVRERMNEYLIYDNELWRLSDPKLAELDDAVLSFQVAPRSEYTAHIPFRVNINDEAYTQYKSDLDDTCFELVLSNAPKRVVVDVVV